MFKYISAGAGCGKTTFIINTIKELVQTTSNRILIITYTNSCVEEIRQRIVLAGLDISVDVYTFHGLCSKYNNMSGVFSESSNLTLLLNYVNNEYYFPDSFKEFYNYFLCHTPIDKNTYMEVLRSKYAVSQALEMEEYKARIQDMRLEDYITTLGTLRSKKPSYIQKKDEETWLKNKELLSDYFDTLNRDYNFLYFTQAMEVEETRKQTNLYTYHHLILHVLDNINEFIAAIYSEYDHIFIDEVQDLSHIQFKIIEKLAEELVFLEYKTITIVGDENQSIYSFQGANKENFHNFIKYIKSIPGMRYEQTQLDKTYRFGGEILDFVNSTFATHTSDIDRGTIYLHPLASNKDELIDQIHNAVSQTLEKDSEASVLVLFHKRSSLTARLEERFSSVKLNRKISGKDPMLVNFFALIKYLVLCDNFSLIEFLLGGLFIIPEPDFCNLVLSNRDKDLWSTIEDQYSKREEVQVLNALKKTKTLDEFLQSFTNSILHTNCYNFYGPNINILLKELFKIKEMDLTCLLELEDKDLWFEQQGQVHLSTVHNSKGMEADYVFIMDGQAKPGDSRITLQNNCPFYNFIQTEEVDNQEFRNLLYVSATRAKKNLQVFALKEKKPSNQSLYYLVEKYKDIK